MTDSYARGGRPRSVPDPDGPAYDAMVRKQRQLNDKQHGDSSWSAHPGVGESLIPVWGSAREAIADYHEGDYVGAAGNTVLALTDLIPAGMFVKAAGKGAIKGAVKIGGSNSWDATRKWMMRKGLAEPGLENTTRLFLKEDGGKRRPMGSRTNHGTSPNCPGKPIVESILNSRASHGSRPSNA